MVKLLSTFSVNVDIPIDTNFWTILLLLVVVSTEGNNDSYFSIIVNAVNLIILCCCSCWPESVGEFITWIIEFKSGNWVKTKSIKSCLTLTIFKNDSNFFKIYKINWNVNWIIKGFLMIVNPLIKTVFPNGAKIIFSLINLLSNLVVLLLLPVEGGICKICEYNKV